MDEKSLAKSVKHSPCHDAEKMCEEPLNNRGENELIQDNVKKSCFDKNNVNSNWGDAFPGCNQDVYSLCLLTAENLNPVTSSKSSHMYTFTLNTDSSNSFQSMCESSSEKVVGLERFEKNPNQLVFYSPVVNKKLCNNEISSSLNLRDSERKEGKGLSEKEKRKHRSSNILSIKSRESHNEKERKRRLRIKHSCDMLKMLIPGLTEKTDKATVLEHTVHYILNIQRTSN